eukprot:gnl/TRDRNA2_/TRDRNA2_141187_c0_seq1.p1 gnl/TRDRNA2_/TRDRNA2_141187_c0~~gnl/TRDRNA2_/TRDRNA2_141187_c0_seq1.p1  ORF type:complete len:292 (-),score=21.02 gnl/TRDRNA2_/TRDRNA2_141187_c0_seq1:148-990(-)
MPQATQAGEPTAEPAHCIVLIPGNPGIPGFYADFADLLAKYLGTTVIVLGLAGHTVSQSTVPNFDIQEQVAHVVAYLDEADFPGEVTLMGHSIGVYIALEAWRRRPSAAVRLLGLMPYIENVPAQRFELRVQLARMYYWLLPLWYMGGLVLEVLRWLPRSFTSWVVRRLEPNSDESTVEFVVNSRLRGSVLMQCLYLARTEFLNHVVPYDWDSLSSQKQHIRLLYAAGDVWGTPESAARARAAGVETTSIPDVPHVFSTRTAYADKVAQWVVSQIRAMAK